jgi:hypothetical protein
VPAKIIKALFAYLHIMVGERDSLLIRLMPSLENIFKKNTNIAIAADIGNQITSLV